MLELQRIKFTNKVTVIVNEYKNLVNSSQLTIPFLNQIVKINFQELKYSLEKKMDIIQASIKEALESVHNNRANKKDEGAQQLQKLKSSTTDVKVRFDTVS